MYSSRASYCRSSLREIVFTEQRERGSETRGRWWKEGKVKRTVFIVWPVASIVVLFASPLFALIRPSRRSITLPRQPRSRPGLYCSHPSGNPIRRLLYSYLKYWSGEGGRQRSPSLFLPGLFTTLGHLQAAVRSPFFVEPPRPDPGGWWLLPFFSFRLRAWRNGEKSRERNERTVGMTWLEGMLLLLSSLSLSLFLSFSFSLTCKQVSMQCSLEPITIKSIRNCML